ncbi:nitrilase-related carbon-nitrogen hydrolase [Colwellia piezophila]|uniref:nitrilase-related carbon-nitrogen hydrolase n=1 Tax=Colwellia piezophila TaxID=211668 RepID=UPI00037AF2E0|nr:nitrilase-related carbon-nitrogen hydrolase [Colwellia piezophila]
MRVAVTQFATSSNPQENLVTCLRLIDKAATCQPKLIVLPEFSNSLFSNTLANESQGNDLQSGYIDHNQAWYEALPLEGEFIKAIAAQAKKHHCYLVINVTLRRDKVREHQDALVKSNISVCTCLFSPLGELIHQQDKQALTELENEFFISSSLTTGVITTDEAKIGLLSGNDSLTFNAARDLALSGATLLCNSISTCALDQTSFHDPARAFENNAFVITANKIGSLVAQGKPQATAQVTFEPEQVSIHLGAGQSQIVSPCGKVQAKLMSNEEGFAFAELNLTGAGLDHKIRPDGTIFIKQRREKLYQKLMCETADDKQSNVPITANVAIFATYKSNEQAIEDVCHYIENNLSDIIQLPELFFIADKTMTNDVDKRAEIAGLCEQLIEQVSSVLRPFQYLCTSLILNGNHQAVLISEQGLIAKQSQLHLCQRYQWTTLGDELNIIELPLEQGNIRLAMLTGDDATIPEIVDLAARQGIQVLLIAFDIQERSEVEYNLLSLAAENRICIVAASREKSFANDRPTNNTSDNIYSKNKVKAQKSTGLIANLTINSATKSALLPQWQAPKFRGYSNQPLVKLQYGKITKAVIHPIAACDK